LSTDLFRELGLGFDFRVAHLTIEPDEIFSHSYAELAKFLKRLPYRPDWLVVFGDGNPAAIGALAGARQGISVVHIEAGEMRGKWEHEEINRRIVDSLADLHLCTSRRAISILAQSGISSNVHFTGDVTSEFIIRYAESLPSGISDWDTQDYLLVTIHRPENLQEEPFANIVAAVNDMTRKVIFVCHPRTEHRLLELGLPISPNIEILQPLSYANMLSAIKGCAFLLTDSGGLIREASHLGKRAVVRRNAGGWPELYEAGVNIRVGSTASEIRDGIRRMELLVENSREVPQLFLTHDGLRQTIELLSNPPKTVSPY
jgi:UDP-N-acetylglucosamine 2-epimerase